VSSHDATDEEAIRALVIAYAERLDAGDFYGVAALFEHGVFRSAGGGDARVGSAAVRAMYQPVILYDDGTPRTMHVLGNLRVTIDRDAATATASCTFTVMQAPTAGSLAPTLAGRYDDRFECVDGEWRFTERLVQPDLIGDLSRHMRWS
jgi:ketosteroid isomerase-like protein